MLAVELERYMHAHIPLSKAMAIAVASIESDAVVLTAPLEPNTNHRDTVFAGSASAVAILAGWSLVHVRLRAEGIGNRLVLQRNSMEYLKPIAGQFTARSSLEQPERWRQFSAMLIRKGRARVGVLAVLEQAGQLVGKFAGDFVALAENNAQDLSRKRPSSP